MSAAQNNGFSFSFKVLGQTAEDGSPKPKQKVLRLRVPSKNYYSPKNPKVAPHEQCIRCNEILGARVTTLYTDGDTFEPGPTSSHRRPVSMGVFCAIAALENGESMLGEQEEEV